MAEAPISAPRFCTATEALRWAYARRRGMLDALFIGEAAMEHRLGQALGMVAAVEAFPDERTREYLRARFGGAEDYPHLRMWVMAGLPTGLHKGRGVHRMIGAYFGREAGLKSLQHDLRCTTSKPLMLVDVIEYQRIVRERLRAIRDIAMPAVEKVFRERGWIR